MLICKSGIIIIIIIIYSTRIHQPPRRTKRQREEKKIAESITSYASILHASPLGESIHPFELFLLLGKYFLTINLNSPHITFPRHIPLRTPNMILKPAPQSPEPRRSTVAPLQRASGGSFTKRYASQPSEYSPIHTEQSTQCPLVLLLQCCCCTAKASVLS
jgi:hypothetical protein